ncbi:hypothetical protein FQW43_15335 [Salmonella enterica subsp. enterica serovar Enteritidis]|nr:hypothetical protein [Salmonella enterica subsp. enterica serovar Enteritidis]
MNVEAFIRQHITSALVAEGFSEIVAQGGLLQVLITTGDALRQAVRGVCMRIVSSALASGQLARQQRWNANRQRKSRGEVHPPGCSDFAIAIPLEIYLPKERFHDEP